MANALYYAADHLPVIASIQFNNSVDITSAARQQDLLVYPNPSKGSFTVSLPTNAISILHLTDAMGRTLITESGIGMHTINVTHMPSGVFYLKIEDPAGERTIKLLSFGQ